VSVGAITGVNVTLAVDADLLTNVPSIPVNTPLSYAEPNKCNLYSTSLFIFLKANSECSEMLLEFSERIGSLVPEYWSLKPNFKPEINSFFLSGRGYSINDFSTIK
jgi:hypothetical protein